MNKRKAAAAIVLLIFTGCATVPIPTDLSAVTQNPHQFKNERIVLTGYVIENPPPQGDEYRTWSFVIGSSDGNLRVSEEGFNPSTLEKAHRLVEQARLANEPVTIAGRLRIGPYQEIVSGTEIDLESVRYKDTEINTDKGPFTKHYYPHYYEPLWWRYHYYPYPPYYW
ncbi:MAG: hypothetical protein C4532_20190 [Candidatus Abyssobacteria bacterium SURF_17]|uniref:Outer membrane lipoprotein n=1 Tax=Candidatus Abyssobacteria bacterium SURF_17 TaxID=2093361 RepID=A0A419EMV5_9BACT|nr:MAG: hypothetical protein C4532_20190 [Candidatus Abyssubacteria bacterium SURF_17]